MNLVEAALRQAANDLTDTRLPWALVGGFAVSARTEPRFTRDVDFVVAVADDAQAESFVSELTGRGYRVAATVEHEETARLATVRLTRGPGGPTATIVDLLFASSGIEAEIARQAGLVEVLPRLVLPVAQVGHLIAVKLLASDDETRPQDRADLIALTKVADSKDLQLAREAVALITERGYQRGRDLAAGLAELARQVERDVAT